MKTQIPLPHNLPGKNSTRTLLFALATIIGLFAALNVQAASQTWTNAPVDNTWTNINNWVARAFPGAVNSTTTADIATFNAPLTVLTTNIIDNGDSTFTTNIALIGGAGSPITNDFQRGVRGMVFDTTNCGAYVFGASTSDNQLEIINAGNIVVNAGVTNPITINSGLRAKLPSSTNGRYDFTNNAASPNASLFISTIFNTSANTRPLELHLAGTNTGTNTIARIDDQVAVAGAILIIKEDVGSWILSGPNELPQKTSASVVAVVNVNNGTLRVQDPGSLGAITVANLVVQTAGTLQIDGVTLNNAGLTLRNGGTVRMNGTAIVNGITEANTANTSATLATTSASDVMTVGNGAKTW
jgi:hypothetical protein